jgi:hypothetical protein
MKIVHAYTRRCNSGPWEFYGSFTEVEWQAELAGHLAFLRSMGPLYVLTNPSGKRAQLQLPQCGPLPDKDGARPRRRLWGAYRSTPAISVCFRTMQSRLISSACWTGNRFDPSRPDS